MKATCTSAGWRDIRPIIQSAGQNLNHDICFMSKKKPQLVEAVGAGLVEEPFYLNDLLTSTSANRLYCKCNLRQSYTKTAYLQPVAQKRWLGGIRSSAQLCLIGTSYRSALP